jgi:putative ABC transport system ATP-binding protein
MKTMIKIKHAKKSYCLGDSEIKAIDNVSFEVKKGEFVAIIGPSGSGKSTFMNILGLLDVLDSGDYYLNEVNTKEADENELADIRNQKIGFIFQNFNLLPRMTATENIEIPLIYNGKTEDEAKEIAREMLKKVGLEKRSHHLPKQLSGGQQQRVAIARALSCNPEIILADEPTGALDSKTGVEIMNLLDDLNKKGQTIILITHDQNIANRAKRIVKISDGALHE